MGPATAGGVVAECDATFKLGVFTFDKDSFALACAGASDGCTFTAADYSYLALGILMTPGNTACGSGGDGTTPEVGPIFWVNPAMNFPFKPLTFIWPNTDGSDPTVGYYVGDVDVNTGIWTKTNYGGHQAWDFRS